MGSYHSKSVKKTKTYFFRLAINIFLLSFSLSIILSFTSQIVLTKASIVFAFFVLLFIVFVGIIFDIVGVAVATADAGPFHAMAAKKNPRAKIAIFLLKKASLVATFSNDVVGDIAGIISGAAVASIVFRMVSLYELSHGQLYNVLLSSIAAGLTVGGKALGKELALKKSKEIVYFVATILYNIQSVFKVTHLLKRK